MIVECENCRSTFRLDEALVKAGGTKVKCSLCESVFVVVPFEDLSDSLDEEKTGLEGEEEAAPTIEFIAPASDEAGEDGRLEADPDTVYRDVFRESAKDWEAEEETETGPSPRVEDARGAGKEVIEEETLSADRSSANSLHMSDLEEERAEEARDVPFEPPGAEDPDLDAPPGGVEEPSVKRKKSVISRIITVVLVIFLFVLAAGAALVLLRPQWIPPSLSFLKPPVKKEVSDAGVRLLMFKGVSASFVDTEKAGNLFVIRGEVSSKYRKPRSYLLIKGNILDETGQVIKSELSYAGNTFTDDELKMISYEEIKRAMRNKDGMARQNFNVPSGASIPFMIAFQNLPDNLSEFTVEAVSSSPGT